MSATRVLRLVTFASALVAVGAGCSGGGNGGSGDGRADKLLVGGALFYCRLNPAPRLAGVSVMLTDFEGDTLTATSGSDGLWQRSNVPEGIYQISYELPGYETRERIVVVSQAEGTQAEYVHAGDECLSETLATASIAPFGIALTNFVTAYGEAGSPIDYSRSAHGDIVITFDRPVLNFGLGNGASPYIYSPNSGFTAYPTGDQTHTVFTFDEGDLIFGAGGISTQGTLTDLYLQNLQQEDPINGGLMFFEASLRFRGIP